MHLIDFLRDIIPHYRDEGELVNEAKVLTYFKTTIETNISIETKLISLQVNLCSLRTHRIGPGIRHVHIE